MPTPSGFSSVSVWIKCGVMTRPAAITFGVTSGVLAPDAVHTQIAASLGGAASWKSKLSNSSQLNRIRVSTGVSGGDDLVSDKPIAVTGTYTGSFVPANCSLLVHKRTIKAGQRGRGRMFFPWMLLENKVDEAGMIDATELLALQGVFDAWLADLNSRSLPMVLLHQPGISPEGPPSLVNSLSLDPQISTQKRRLGR